MSYTITLSDDQLHSLQELIAYVIETEQECYDEWMQEKDDSGTFSHIYDTAIELSKIQFIGE